MAAPPTATRHMTATESLAHAAPAVHVAATLNPAINKTAVQHSRTDGHRQHADRTTAAYDEVHQLPDFREAGR
jgi:hypothetical protein